MLWIAVTYLLKKCSTEHDDVLIVLMDFAYIKQKLMKFTVDSMNTLQYKQMINLTFCWFVILFLGAVNRSCLTDFAL